MIRIVFLCLLVLGGCSTLKAVQTASTSTVSQSSIDTARSAVFGIKALYGVAVIAADGWAKQPPCGKDAPSPPLCSTDRGTVALYKALLAVQSVVAQAEKTVLAASPSQSDLNLAVSAVNNSWAAYQQIATIYGLKGA